MAHRHNLSNQDEQEDSCEFKASSGYKVNSRTALDIIDPDSKTKQQKVRILSVALTEKFFLEEKKIKGNQGKQDLLKIKKTNRNTSMV